MVVMTSASMRHRQARITGLPPQPQPKPLRGKHDRRLNTDREYQVPEGYLACPDPTCSDLVDRDEYPGKDVVCRAGHSFDLSEVEARIVEANGKAGGWTHCGLSSAQVGAIGEAVVRDHGDMKHLGQTGSKLWSEVYHNPFDGMTDQGVPLEVRTIDWASRNRAFRPDKVDERQPKMDYMLAHNIERVGCILVGLDFRRSLAYIYIREMLEVGYFDDLGKPDFVVLFDNPFVIDPTPVVEIPF